ncbi:MAG TPA: hypothetical protein VNR89_09895 [Roseomonas sp.]|nr:hypothetical protein [Roseomonas sp.]
MAVIVGSEIADRMIAPDAREDDIIYSLSGDDFIEARGGTDLIAPGPGNDRIEGGDGRDTILLSGTLGEYQLFRHDNEGIIRGPEGVDQLLDVEAVRTDISGTRDLSSVPEFSGLAYLASYADLAQALGTDEGAAWAHFYHFGAYEGRSITFNETSYLAANTDLLGSSMYGPTVEDGPTMHYLLHGRAEGRATDFDGVTYIASYVDLINGYGNSGDAAAVDAAGTQHFVQFGFQEGRQTDLFNEVAYAAQNPDLPAGGLVTEEQLALHWIQHGIYEGRAGAYDPVIA